MTEADSHDLLVEGRLSAVEAKIDMLAARDAEILKALDDLKVSHRSLETKIDHYQMGAKVVIGVGTAITGLLWFLWVNFGQWIIRR